MAFIACGAFVGGARCKTWLEFGKNAPLDVTHLLRCGDVHMNPGPSSDQHSDDLQHTGIPHNLRRTHNGDHLRIVYTTAYLRFL